ncbi:hypothetical protein RJ639_023712 [Escallonia herrerae]|uniref:C2 domain-containing protein n=1 Tax=Escallonia herrerae TaxID=1293975 RepID=A0AA89ADF8_9ASTE|nr:hypothetical protein RJ639_023712 [Escallonia herrerae]
MNQAQAMLELFCRDCLREHISSVVISVNLVHGNLFRINPFPDPMITRGPPGIQVPSIIRIHKARNLTFCPITIKHDAKNQVYPRKSNSSSSQKEDVDDKCFLTSDPETTLSTKIINGGGRNPIFDENFRLMFKHLTRH